MHVCLQLTSCKEELGVIRGDELVEWSAERAGRRAAAIVAVHSGSLQIIRGWVPRGTLSHTSNKRPSSSLEVVLTRILGSCASAHTKKKKRKKQKQQVGNMGHRKITKPCCST